MPGDHVRFTARTVGTCTSLFQIHTPYSFPGEKSHGDVGALFAVLRSECDFGGNGDGSDNLEAPGDIGERIVQIATTGAGFRRGRFTGRSCGVVLGSRCWGDPCRRPD